MNGLFLDQAPLTFEKTAAEVALPDDPNTWMHEVLQELHKSVPYVADFDVRVVMQRVDAEKGYGVGHFEVTSKTDLQPEEGTKKLRAAGVSTVQIPILIRDKRLKPIDLLIDFDGKVMPLTEERLRRALFRPHPFDTVETTPGDTSLVGQLYPPGRETFGMGGGTVGSAGWSKTGSADPFEQWLMQDKTAGVKDIATAAGMKAEDVAVAGQKDALDYWSRWGGDGRAGTQGTRVNIDKDAPDYEFRSRKEQHVAKHASAAPSPAALAREAAKVKREIAKKHPELLKSGGLLRTILPTINAADFDELVRTLETDGQVKAAFQANSHASGALETLSGYDPPSLEQREDVLRKMAGYDVLQIRRLGGASYQVKKAFSGAWDPVSEKIGRGDLYLRYGEKIAADVDVHGSVTTASGNLSDKESPEADKPEHITRFGLYRVQDKDGNDLIGYVFPNLLDTDGQPLPVSLFTNGSVSAVQSDLVGVKVDSGVNVAEGRVQGHGAFVRVLPNGRAEATVPFELGAELTRDGQVGYIGEAFDGRKVTVMVQHGIERVVEVDSVVLIPDTFRWMPLRGGAVSLQDSTDGFDKKASADLLLRGDGTGGFHLEGMAVHSLPEERRSFLSADDAMFLLAGAGVSPKLASSVITRAFGGDRPIPVVPGRTVKSATALRKQAMQKVRERGDILGSIKPPLFLKEAATLSDPDTIDTVLSMGFLNDENLLTFIDALPKLEEAQGNLCKLLLASRMGLSVIPEEAATRVIPGLEKVIMGLKTLAFYKN